MDNDFCNRGCGPVDSIRQSRVDDLMNNKIDELISTIFASFDDATRQRNEGLRLSKRDIHISLPLHLKDLRGIGVLMF